MVQGWSLHPGGAGVLRQPLGLQAGGGRPEDGLPRPGHRGAHVGVQGHGRGRHLGQGQRLQGHPAVPGGAHGLRR